jgi:hypothetical protein
VASDLRGREKASNVRYMSRVNDDDDDDDDSITHRESDLNKAGLWYRFAIFTVLVIYYEA